MAHNIHDYDNADNPVSISAGDPLPFQMGNSNLLIYAYTTLIVMVLLLIAMLYLSYVKNKYNFQLSYNQGNSDSPDNPDNPDDPDDPDDPDNPMTERLGGDVEALSEQPVYHNFEEFIDNIPRFCLSGHYIHAHI